MIEREREPDWCRKVELILNAERRYLTMAGRALQSRNEEIGIVGLLRLGSPMKRKLQYCRGDIRVEKVTTARY